MTNNQKIKLNDFFRSLAGNGLIITDQRKLNKKLEILFGCNSDSEITINKRKEHVLIDVDGGIVQWIYTTSEDIDFTVIDWDNINGGQGEMDLYELGEYGADIITKDEILDSINHANKEILDNNSYLKNNGF